MGFEDLGMEGLERGEGLGLGAGLDEVGDGEVGEGFELGRKLCHPIVRDGKFLAMEVTEEFRVSSLDSWWR